MKKLAVIIGRMQFLHNGHTHLFREALKRAENVLVLIGSADKAPDPKNPFSYAQREAIVHKVFSDMPGSPTVWVAPLPDHYLDEVWASGVMQAVERYSLDSMPETGYLVRDEDVDLVGHEKDESSYYLKMFPQWDFYNAPNERNLSATDFRHDLFARIPAIDIGFPARLRVMMEQFDKKDAGSFTSDVIRLLTEKYPTLGIHFIPNTNARALMEPLDMTHLKLNSPPAMHEFVEMYIHSPEYQAMLGEQNGYDTNKLTWDMAPYENIFVTTDAVVTHKSSILMIRRKNSPGRGLWALPGGFLGPKQWIRDSIIRELREETRIAVPNEDLLRIMQPIQVFDNPSRSLRGRTITHAARFNLDHLGIERPKVRADDDADAVRWFSFAEIQRADAELFEDHAEIIKRLVFSRG